MADKSISELTAASAVNPSDLFVLEQNGTAKKLTGQTLESWLVSFADGHGGIQFIEKTGTSGTNPVVDTYTITYADATTFSFNVTNGRKGDTGTRAYVWIKYASRQPTANSDMGNTPDKWMGIYSGTSASAPTSYTSYAWYEIKGATGDAAVLNTTEVKYQAGTTGTVIPSGTWSDSPPVVAQGHWLWTRTTLTFNSGSPTVFYSAARQGIDGEGAAGSMTPLINVSGGAVGESNSFAHEDHQHPLTTLHLNTTLTSLPSTITDAGILSTMRVVNCVFSNLNAITSNVSWSTANGSLTLSGTMSGSTTVDIDLDVF